MPEFLSPFVIVRERPSAAVALPAVSTATPFFVGTAERGPINRPQFVTGVEDFVSIFGQDDGGDLYQSIVGFFGGGGTRCLIVRVAHYTDITDATTLDAVAASVTLNTAGTSALPAVKLFGGFPMDLSQGGGITLPARFTAQIGGAAAQDADITATPSECTAPGAPGGAGNNGDTMTFQVNGILQTITVAGAPATAAEWAAFISGALVGVSGSVAGGAVVITTDRRGSSADVDYISSTGTAGADSGFGAGPVNGVNAGPNNVSRSDLVTATEWATIVQAAWTNSSGVVATAVGTSQVEVETVDLGAAASISAVTGTGISAVGFTQSPAGEATGTDAGAPVTPTIEAIATSEGDHGNSLAVTTRRVDRVITEITDDLAAGAHTEAEVDSADQIRVGLQLLFEDPVTTEVLRVVVTEIIRGGGPNGNDLIRFESATVGAGGILAANSPTVTKETFTWTPIVNGEPQPTLADLSMSSLDTRFYFGSVIGTNPSLIDPRQRIYAADQSVAFSNTVDPRPVNVTAEPLSGGDDGSAVVDNDYVGSSASFLGLRSLDFFDGFALGAVPGVETSAVHNGLLDYANEREDFLAVMDAPSGMTPQQVVNYKNVTANLFGTYGVMNTPHVRVLRQSTGAVEEFPAVGYVLGMYANVDRNWNVSEAPAGIEKGRLRNVEGVARDNEYFVKANRDIVYPEGINPIVAKPGRGVCVMGQNTLDPTSDRGAIGVRRAFIYLRKAILDLSEFVLFYPNDDELRGRFRKTMRAFLRNQRQSRVLKGSSDAEAFYVICDRSNNPDSIVNARRFVARIGVNVIPGVDFAEIDLERDTRALEQELASAA